MTHNSIYQRLINLAAIAVMTVSLASCTSDTAVDGTVVARVADKTLTAVQIHSAMPGGLTAADSAEYVRTYVNKWVGSTLISEIAAKGIDMTEINRLVEEYRLELISREYRRLMYDSHGNNAIAADTLRAYYDSHSGEFAIDRPLVKGIYLKVPDDAPNLKTLRQLYRSTKAADIDKLEKAATGAIHYDYFRNRYVDWEQIETRIPYDFGPSADAFLRSHHTLDFSAGGFTYLLNITEWLPTGADMPYEAATTIIRERILTERRRDYDTKLRHELLEQALKNGDAEIFIDIKPQ